MIARVAFVRERSYDPPALRASILRTLELLGFDLSSARGQRVLLKPNMLGAYPPSMAVTTHPAFITVIGRLFQEAGARVAVGDSSNGVHGIENTWEATGIRAACREAGLEEVHFEACGSVSRGGFMIARAPLEADVVVNLPKFKTHGLTTLTLAAKNLFGCIAGMQKFGLHRANIARRDFATAVVKIADEVRPALTIIDGIVAMEGNGPSGGTPTALGVIAAGREIHAVDAACCRLVGLPPEELETLAAAERAGLWDASSPIEIVGDPLEELRPCASPSPTRPRETFRRAGMQSSHCASSGRRRGHCPRSRRRAAAAAGSASGMPVRSSRAPPHATSPRSRTRDASSVSAAMRRVPIRRSTSGRASQCASRDAVCGAARSSE